MPPITASADPFTYQTYGASTDVSGQTGAYYCGQNAITDPYHIVSGGDNNINMADTVLLTTTVSSVSLRSYADVSQNMLTGNVSTYSGQCNSGPVGGEGYVSSMIYDTYTITSSSLDAETPIDIGFNWKLKGHFSNPSLGTGNVLFRFSRVNDPNYGIDLGEGLFSRAYDPEDGLVIDESGLLNYNPTYPLRVGDTFMIVSKLEVWSETNSNTISATSDFSASVSPVPLTPGVTITGLAGGTMPIAPVPELNTVVLVLTGLVGLVIISKKYRGN